MALLQIDGNNFLGEVISKVIGCRPKFGIILKLEYRNQSKKRYLRNKLFFLKKQILSIIRSENNLPFGKQYFDKIVVKFLLKMKRFDSVTKRISSYLIILNHLKLASWTKSVFMNAGLATASKGRKIKNFVEKYPISMEVYHGEIFQLKTSQ